MRKSIALALLLSLAQLSFAQKSHADSLNLRLSARSGEDYVRYALLVSEAFVAEGNAEKAAEIAERAAEKAKTLNLKELTAECLNQQAKALMSTPNTRNRALNQATKLLEESNGLSADQNLRIDNTKRLLELATRLDKRKDIDRLGKELAILQGKEQVRKANEELTELSKEQKQLQNQQSTLLNILQRKELDIQKMTDAQIRAQLLVSEKERIVDSMTFVSIVDSFQLTQTEMLLAKQESDLREQEAEIRMQRLQRNLLIAIAGAVFLLALGLFHRFHVISRHNAVLAEKNKIIEEERKRNEELLLNILPKAIAEELKNKGVAETQHYDEATVLFADFVGFSSIAQKLTPEKLVADLDYAFKHFDEIIGKNSLEKIKTIGDAYMCAGGLPTNSIGHPARVVKAALEMQQFLKQWNSEKRKNGEPTFEARVGIHTGPLIAGVVGSKKFAYDIWGDTVNVASRMESSSEAGKVNISNATFEHVKNDFDCEYRGKVPAKNVGEVEMYYVNSAAA